MSKIPKPHIDMAQRTIIIAIIKQMRHIYPLYYLTIFLFSVSVIVYQYRLLVTNIYSNECYNSTVTQQRPVFFILLIYCILYFY